MLLLLLIWYSCDFTNKKKTNYFVMQSLELIFYFFLKSIKSKNAQEAEKSQFRRLIVAERELDTINFK